MAHLHLSDAHALYQVLQDPGVQIGLKSFFIDERDRLLQDLVKEVRKVERDTMKEAFLAGKIDAAETQFLELQNFAKRMIQEGQ